MSYYKYLASAVVLSLVATGALLYWGSFANRKLALRVSTTTSLYATGLLDALAEDFGKRCPNVVLQFIAVGSGEALRKASMGDADVVLVHAPGLEKKYIEEGVISEGKIFAYNYFVIVGPKDDPAKITGLDPLSAMSKIYEAGEKGLTKFISRGDNSGTHQRELMLWAKVGLKPKGRPWYVETGSGMSQTLLIANEMEAYTLSDIGTYLKLKDKLKELKALVIHGDILMNIYSSYVVTSSDKKDLAREFVEYLTSEEAQSLIENFGLKEHGQPLFYPASSRPLDELYDAWKRLSKSDP
ncbi:MAG: extracellular solute-binding protein [Thermoprotei archaeon]|nr:extracellular solute-binding protein [Thermoprotei archaeon]